MIDWVKVIVPHLQTSAVHIHSNFLDFITWLSQNGMQKPGKRSKVNDQNWHWWVVLWASFPFNPINDGSAQSKQSIYCWLMRKVKYRIWSKMYVFSHYFHISTHVSVVCLYSNDFITLLQLICQTRLNISVKFSN